MTTILTLLTVVACAVVGVGIFDLNRDDRSMDNWPRVARIWFLFCLALVMLAAIF